jgi:hypothetical protein
LRLGNEGKVRVCWISDAYVYDDDGKSVKTKKKKKPSPAVCVCVKNIK